MRTATAALAAVAGMVTTLVGAYLFVIDEVVVVVGVDPRIDHVRVLYLDRMPTVGGLGLHVVGLAVAAAGLATFVGGIRRARSHEAPAPGTGVV